SGTFDAAQPDASRTGETHTVEWQAPAVAITRTATQARQSNSVDLDKARLVVSVGRGIGSKENIALAEQLCKAIGAELACSRPVAENEKWMEHERYVGISNLMLKPELYLAVGISGQIQHMVGANGSQPIFAINNDKNAPIFRSENIALAEQLCKAIGAELACSRPVAENEKWMEHERYVGISNLMLKPELYLAVGISGQIQHMVGANASQTIFAINKDKNAPIFQYADYGIVGDAVKILPALTAALAR